MTGERQGERTRRAGPGEASSRVRERVVPHNLQAEESLLGAALLSRSALEVMARELVPGDFYKPAHQHVAAALYDAFEHGWPADPVTVADFLGRQGLLDSVGGSAALVALQSGTPATTSAARYCSIVHDHATLRRLVGSGAEIAELAYSLPEDAHSAVERARELLDTVSANNGARTYSTLEIADVGALLDSDLEASEAELLTRTDGRRLLYAGKMHFLQGEPSSGKSWVALYAALEILILGGSVAYIDFEDTSREIVTRMLQIGADPAAVRSRFSYIQPMGALGPTEKAELDRHLAALNPDLVVIDGVAEALAREGLREDLATDVIPWIEKLPRPLARAGAAVVMIDHVVKDKEQQGRWARGSSAKLAVVDGATYQVKVVRPFDRRRDGVLKLVIAKDKPGAVGAMGDTAAIVTVEPKADGARVVIRVDPDTAEISSSDTWKPTRIMRRISDELDQSSTPLTPTQLRALIHSDKPRIVSEAISRLIAEGYIAERKDGRTKVLVSVARYLGDEHEEDLPPPAEPEPELFDESSDNPADWARF